MGQDVAKKKTATPTSSKKTGKTANKVAKTGAAAKPAKLGPKAAANVPDDDERLDHLLIEAEDAFEDGDPEKAAKVLRKLVAEDPEDPDAWQLLGWCYEDLESDEGCREAFTRVFELDRKLNAKNRPRVPRARFEKLLEEAISGLDSELKAALDKVAVRIADYPEEWILEEDVPMDPRGLVGLSAGPTLAELGAVGEVNLEPPTIHIFHRNLERDCEDDEIVDEIAVTLIHELGHFLGLSEEDLHERGLE